MSKNIIIKESIPKKKYEEITKIITRMGLHMDHAIVDGIFCLDYMDKLCRLFKYGDFYDSAVQDEIYNALLEYKKIQADCSGIDVVGVELDVS